MVSDWYIQKDYGASAFWHSYLVYRVQNETSTGQRHFLDIRRVSEEICEEGTAQLDLTTTIEALCWPALQDAMWHSYPRGATTKKPSSPGLDLLCAAAYLNVIPLAKRLLQEGHRPTSVSHIFSFSPMGLAAWAGNAEMMQLFQENLPEYDENGMRDSLIGVAIRGDIMLARLAIYPPSRATPDSTDVAGQQFGKLDRGFVGMGMSHAQRSTRNVELYQYFEGFFAKPDDLKFTLVKNAHIGNLEMVRYLLDAGADIRGTMGRFGNPLCVSDPSYSADFRLFSQPKTNYKILVYSVRPVGAMKILSTSCLREEPTQTTAVIGKEYKVGTRFGPQRKQVVWLLFVSSSIMVAI